MRGYLDRSLPVRELQGRGLVGWCYRDAVYQDGDSWKGYRERNFPDAALRVSLQRMPEISSLIMVKAKPFGYETDIQQHENIIFVFKNLTYLVHLLNHQIIPKLILHIKERNVKMTPYQLYNIQNAPKTLPNQQNKN